MAQRVPRVVKIQPAKLVPDAPPGFGFKLIGGIPVLVESVVPGSRAEAAGLIPGDRIVGINGNAVNGLPHLEIVERIKKTPPTSPLRLVAVNDGPEAVGLLREAQNDPDRAASPPSALSTPSPSRLPRRRKAAMENTLSPLNQQQVAPRSTQRTCTTPSKLPSASPSKRTPHSETTRTPQKSDASPKKTPTLKGSSSPKGTSSKRTPSRNTPSRSTPLKNTSSKGTPSKSTSPKKSPSSKSPSDRSTSPRKTAARSSGQPSSSPRRPTVSSQAKMAKSKAVRDGSSSPRSKKPADPVAAHWTSLVSSEAPEHAHIYGKSAWQPDEATGDGPGMFKDVRAWAILRPPSQTNLDSMSTASFAKLVSFDHDNVARLAGVCRLNKESACIAWTSELAPLSKYIIAGETDLPQLQKHIVCQKISNGLKYLHDRGVVHGRLDSSTVLVSSDLTSVQLCDYGTAQAEMDKFDDMHALGAVIRSVMSMGTQDSNSAIMEEVITACQNASVDSPVSAEFICFKIAMLLEDEDDDSSSDDDDSTDGDGASEDHAVDNDDGTADTHGGLATSTAASPAPAAVPVVEARAPTPAAATDGGNASNSEVGRPRSGDKTASRPEVESPGDATADSNGHTSSQQDTAQSPPPPDGGVQSVPRLRVESVADDVPDSPQQGQESEPGVDTPASPASPENGAGEAVGAGRDQSSPGENGRAADNHDGPSSPKKTKEASPAEEKEDEDDDLDFFSILSRAKNEHRDKDSKWTVEHDEIHDGPSDSELAMMSEPERWRVHFRYLLASDEGIHCFRKFLKVIVAQENIDFWVDCQGLADLESDPSRLAQGCEAIYKKYLTISSSKAVNINGVNRAVVEANMQKRNFSRHTFAVAQKEIYFLMKRDCYPKYLESDALTKTIKSWTPLKAKKAAQRSQRASTLSPAGPSERAPPVRAKFFSFRRSKAPTPTPQ
eukprot:m.93777 g.93777  ORF g.93777 m.93777 type:complete len:949 (-) comp10016_c0_seq2:14-2860(-)